MKILPLLKVLPVIFAIVTTIAFVSIHQSIVYERDIVSKQAVFKQLGIDLMSASDYLTEQAQTYVVTGDTMYYDNYFREINFAQRRENAVKQLTELGAPKEELDMLSKAKLQSNGLEEIEKLAFEYVAKGDMVTAQNIIFGDVYYREKMPIINTLMKFQSIMNDRCEAQAKEAEKQATISIVVAFAAMISIIVVVFLYFLLINSKIRVINYIEENLDKITDGDFDVSIDASKAKSGDEFGTLSRSFMRLMDTIHGINLEIKQLLDDAAAGNLTQRADVSNFDGEWEKLLVQLNHLIAVFFEKIINSAPLAYAIVTDDVVQECNDYAKKNLGIVSGERFEKYFESIEDAKKIKRLLNRNMSVTREEVRLKFNNDESFRYYISVNTFEYANSKTSVVWGIDIEEDRAKSDLIKRAQEDMQKLIDALPIAMLILDPETNTVIYCNRTCLRMFDFRSLSEACNTDIAMMYAKVQPDGMSQFKLDKIYRENILGSKDIVTTEFRFVSASGEEFDTKIFGGEIIYNGQRSIIQIIHDISAEKKQTLMLQNAAEKEKEANKLKSRFLVNMSHEIRTPMNAIIGLSQVALLKNQNTENYDTLKKINLSSKNLLTIINDILDFSKIEADRLDLDEQEFCFEDVISNAMFVAYERIGDKNVEMISNMSDDCPFFIVGDKIRLWQILKNLLDNSAKYTNEGTIVLETSVDSWETDANGVKTKACIAMKIKDTGIGMTSEQIVKIFEPFEQFSKSDKELSRGTGLGMSITERLVNLMGGSLTVDSEIGIGTCVTVKICFKLKEGTLSKKDVIAKNNMSGMSIMTVNVNDASGEVIMNLLRTAGADTVCANSGDNAVKLAKQRDSTGDPFNVVIIDYMLNNETGLDVLKQLQPYIKNNPKILMVSAYFKQLLYSDIHRAGFNDIIEKPFVPSQFVRRVYESLNSLIDTETIKYLKFKDAKILLCEDNIINQDVAVGMFEVFGINPVVANNGKEALDLLKGQTFHIVYMDILMPEMDGHEATVAIRNSDTTYRNIPIIATTANVMRDEVELCMSEGMNGHLGKPIDIDELYETLVKHLPPSLHYNSEIYENERLRDDNVQTLEGVDISSGIAKYGGNKDKYFKALYKFAENLNPEKYRFDNPSKIIGDVEALKQIHMLKGTSGNLFVTRINSAATLLEQSISTGFVEALFCNDLFEAVYEMKNKILDFVPRYMEIKPVQPQNTSDI